MTSFSINCHPKLHFPVCPTVGRASACESGWGRHQQEAHPLLRARNPHEANPQEGPHVIRAGGVEEAASRSCPSVSTAAIQGDSQSLCVRSTSVYQV